MDVVIPVARAIQNSARSIDEVATLITISFYEHRYRTDPGVHGATPFGVTAFTHHRSDIPLDLAALVASANLIIGRQSCGRNLATLLGWYNTGSCAPNEYSRRQTRTIARLLRRARMYDIEPMGLIVLPAIGIQSGLNSEEFVLEPIVIRN